MDNVTRQCVDLSLKKDNHENPFFDLDLSGVKKVTRWHDVCLLQPRFASAATATLDQETLVLTAFLIKPLAIGSAITNNKFNTVLPIHSTFHSPAAQAAQAIYILQCHAPYNLAISEG